MCFRALLAKPVFESVSTLDWIHINKSIWTFIKSWEEVDNGYPKKELSITAERIYTTKLTKLPSQFPNIMPQVFNLKLWYPRRTWIQTLLKFSYSVCWVSVWISQVPTFHQVLHAYETDASCPLKASLRKHISILSGSNNFPVCRRKENEHKIQELLILAVYLLLVLSNSAALGKLPEVS